MEIELVPAIVPDGYIIQDVISGAEKRVGQTGFEVGQEFLFLAIEGTDMFSWNGLSSTIIETSPCITALNVYIDSKDLDDCLTFIETNQLELVEGPTRYRQTGTNYRISFDKQASQMMIDLINSFDDEITRILTYRPMKLIDSGTPQLVHSPQFVLPRLFDLCYDFENVDHFQTDQYEWIDPTIFTRQNAWISVHAPKSDLVVWIKDSNQPIKFKASYVERTLRSELGSKYCQNGVFVLPQPICTNCGLLVEDWAVFADRRKSSQCFGCITKLITNINNTLHIK